MRKTSGTGGRKWIDPRAVPAGILLLTALLATLAAGCSTLRGLTERVSRPRQVAAAALPAESALDSLWRSNLAADTVRLSGRPAPAPEEILPEERRGPSAATLGRGLEPVGYRVQLAATEQREELEKLGRSVEREFQTTAYIERHDGRFSLRIGNFLRLEEAEALRRRAVSFGFKHAWIVQTRIAPGQSQP